MNRNDIVTLKSSAETKVEWTPGTKFTVEDVMLPMVVLKCQGVREVVYYDDVEIQGGDELAKQP